MSRNQKIYQRLNEDYKYLEDLGYNVVGVYLQGSQNYGLDYEGSDIDTKAIVVPTLKDIVLNKQPVSTTLILESNEHLDVKDIRLMVDCFKKQNINFLEILFTPFRVENTDNLIRRYWFPMFKYKEAIAHYNNYRAVKSIAGMVYEKRKALCHPYPTLAEKVKTWGYDNKQLHHILRCAEFLERYIAGESYEDCLKSKQADYLKSVKSEYIYTVDEAIKIADTTVDYVHKIKEDYMNNNSILVNKEIEEIMEEVMYNIIKYFIDKE